MDDRHVLASALRSGAQVIVTYNLKDFPADVLKSFGIEPQSPDEFVLNLLDLAGIPVRAAERDATHPIVIAGGHSTMNPEPMHAFIDAFAIGEGEEVIHDIVNTIQKFKKLPNLEQSGSLYQC